MLQSCNKLFIKLALFACLCFVISGQPVWGSGDWLFDLEQALKEAKSQKKMVLVDITAEWCRFCTKMNVEIFQKNEFRKIVSDTYVLVSIDADQQREVVEKYAVQGLPTVVFLDLEGKEIHRIVGYRTYNEFMEELKKIKM